MKKDTISIGGASGFWGDSITGPMQLLASGNIDYLVFDYLAELTMSLLVSARGKNPGVGYATDFITVAMKSILQKAATHGVRIIANAGGVNPRACAQALQKLASTMEIDLRIAVVEGDDVTSLLPALRNENLADMNNGQHLPDEVLSANAYLGALPIKLALDAGAQVVITGRCVDSALTLGPLLHEFGWSMTDYDRLAAGSLAGHILECGCQGTGGLHTDWESVPDWAHSGYPIVVCKHDGNFIVTKPEGSGGLVTVATVAEQLLYEIADPRNYILPDVICDFSEVELTQLGSNQVAVRNVKGQAPTSTYKICATYADGYRCTAQLTVVGIDAERKIKRTAEAILERTRDLFKLYDLPDYTATHLEILGSGASFGGGVKTIPLYEAVMWLAVAHSNKHALEIFAREIAPAGTSWAPGTTGANGRPGVTPAIKQFAFLLDKQRVRAVVTLNDGSEILVPLVHHSHQNNDSATIQGGVATTMPGAQPDGDTDMETVPLIRLAYARSGDKGDISNIGVIARCPRYLQVLQEQLTADKVAQYLAHLVRGKVTRYALPGIHAWNFVCEQALGGGGMASLRNDPLGKGMAQILLTMPIQIPRNMLS